MEYVTEDSVSRPARPLLQSKPSPPPPLHRPTAVLSVASSLAILILVLNFSEPYKSLFLWLSFSLLLGPFAPPSLTAGDIRVGIGPPISPNEEPDISQIEKPTRKSAKKPSSHNPYVKIESSDLGRSTDLGQSVVIGNGEPLMEYASEKIEWNEADGELLKKLMAKNPVGKPGRWEDIARGFNGRFNLDFVIHKGKEMGTRNPYEEDSYSKFLKQRKTMDKRAINDPVGETQRFEEVEEKEENKMGSEWCAGDDLALLNALKAFPKDAPLRWEKVAASVPGKTKAACAKRLSELKKNFRSIKVSSGQG